MLVICAAALASLFDPFTRAMYTGWMNQRVGTMQAVLPYLRATEKYLVMAVPFYVFALIYSIADAFAIRDGGQGMPSEVPAPTFAE